jgi:hypothetical protein
VVLNTINLEKSGTWISVWAYLTCCDSSNKSQKYLIKKWTIFMLSFIFVIVYGLFWAEANLCRFFCFVHCHWIPEVQLLIG